MHKNNHFIIILTLLFSTLSSITQATPKNNTHLLRGKELYRAERWIDAQIELLKAKDEVRGYNHTQNQEIDFYLSLCSVKLEDRSALDALSNFQSLYPYSIHSNQVEFNKGLLFCTIEDYNSAHTELLNVDYAKLSHEEKADYNIRMGYINFLKGDYRSAITYLNRIDTNSEYYHHAVYYKSYIDYANQELASAKKGFEWLLTNDAYSAVAPYYLLQIESQQGNYKYVISNGEVLMNGATPSQRAEIARTIAEAYFKKSDFEQAIKFITIYRNSGTILNREDNYILGFSLYRITQYAAAQTYLKAASGADDELTQNASYHLAGCYLRAGEKREAMKAFAMASNDKFNKEIAEDALFNYGKLQYELGGGIFNEAINILTRYINKYPNSDRAQEAKKLLVAAYYNSDNYDAAYRAIKEVKNPDSDIKSALQKITYFKALDAMNNGDNNTAKNNLSESEAIGISPKYSSLAKFWRGEISYIEGDYKLALDDYNRYLARAPKGDHTYIMAQYSTGYALLKLKKEDSALEYFRKFTQIHNSKDELSTDAYCRIGDILYEKRMFVDAAKNYKIAAESENSGRYYAQYQLAMVDGIRGVSSNKISGLKNIIISNKGEYVDDATYELGRTYMTKGNYKDAAQIFEKYIDRFTTSSLYSQALSDLALCYLNLGEKSKSINYYDRVIKSAPQSVVSKDAIQGIREIYIDSGDAKGYFEYAEKMGIESDLGAVTRDSLSFASAQRLYLSSDDRERAESSLEEYVQDYPKGYYLTDALFLLSDCYLKNNKTKSAISSLIRLSESGGNQYTERALDRLSQLTLKEKMYPEAASAYRKLYDIVKGDAKKATAMEGYVNSVIATNDNDAILKMTNDVLSQDKAGYKATVKAKYTKATIMREAGSWDEAIKLYSDLSIKPNDPIGAEATYYIIDYTHRNGEIDKAEELIFKFSDSQTTQAYWLAKSFILLGDIYIAREDSFQARATYQSIVDGYAVSNDGIIDEAKSKIEKL